MTENLLLAVAGGLVGIVATRFTLDALVALRVIPSVRVGRRRLFRVADVQSWIDRLAATGENPNPVLKRAALKAKAA